MKSKRLITFSLFLPLSLSGISTLSSSSHPFTAGLEGGVKVSYTKSDNDSRSALLLKPNVTADFSGQGLALRIKNHITSGEGSPLFFYLNETDSDRVQAGLGTETAYTLYHLDGREETKTYRSGDHAAVLPASFDGYLYLPYGSFGLLEGYGSGDKSFDYSTVYGIYLEVNTYYDAFSVFSLGGIEKKNADNTASTLLDPKALNDLTYSSYYAKDYNGTYLNLEHESVGGGGIEADMDYQKLALTGTLDKGATVSYLAAESDISAQWGIVPSLRNYGSDTHALAFRIKNHTSISTPITIGVKNRSGNTFYLNKSTGKHVFFRETDDTLSVNSWRDWDSALVIPSSFDGWMILPFALFHTVQSADPGDVRQIVFSTSIFKNYDAFTNLTFGDIRIVKNDMSITPLLTPSSLDDASFAKAFVKNTNADYIRFNRYEEVTETKKVGDVKFLERFRHVKDDRELNSEFPVWSGGSKLTTTLVDTKDGNKGMQIDIGATIPNNNIYGSINVFPKSYVPDWNNWADGGENKDLKAKGLTCYIRNNSRKEIIFNLEFDEITKKNDKNVTERFNIQLGAMVFYYDINTGEEFIRMAKPAIVIPIGFEGYLRMDFSQYQVPAWCTDGDLQLDLTGNMAGIYITTDCSNNEGLSFVISDIGVYYNRTEISTLFEESPYSIRNNMKGGE